MTSKSCLSAHAHRNLLLGWFLSTGALVAAPPFGDRFLTDANTPPWNFGFQDPTHPGLVLAPAELGQGKLSFSTNVGVSTAWQPYLAGTEPFQLETEITMDIGKNDPWRYSGVWIGLSSERPDSLSQYPNALTLLMSLHLEGLTAGVYSGEPFRSKFYKEIPARGVLTQGGAGGHFTSMDWPSSIIVGRHFRFVLSRDAQSNLNFKIIEAGNGAVWMEKGFTLPAAWASVPLKYLAIKTIREEYTNVTVTPTAPSAGKIQGIQVWNPVTHQPPQPTRLTSLGIGLEKGQPAQLVGDGFKAGAKVFVGSLTATVTSLLPQQIQITIPNLAPNTLAPVEVINGDGLFGRLELPVSLSKRSLTRVEPREASAAGGDTVTVYGSGFDSQTRFTVNGVACEILGALTPESATLRVPAGTMGKAVLAATSGSESFVGTPPLGLVQHPYVIIPAGTLKDIRAKFNMPQFADYKKVLLTEGAKQASQLGVSGSSDYNNVLSTYMLCYLLTGDPVYKEKLWHPLDSVLTTSELSEFMGSGLMLQVSLVYDALFDQLSRERKINIIRFLDRAMEVYNIKVKNKDWWYANNPSNVIPVGSSAAGTAAATLMYSSDSAAALIPLSVKTLKANYGAMLNEGSCVEGTLYWDYGFTHQLALGHYLKNATGNDQGLLDTPALKNANVFLGTLLGADGYLVTFNDTQPFLTGLAIAAESGSRYDQPLMRWYADHVIHQLALATTDTLLAHRLFVRSSFTGLGFFWQDLKSPPSVAPMLPTASPLWQLSWGTFRSSGDLKPALFAGLKGRDGEMTHHTEADEGSFIVQSRDHSWLIDPGYFQPDAVDHSLPLIDSAGPNERGTAKLLDWWENGPRRGGAVDATPAYSTTAKVKRFVRHLVMLDSSAIVILDDLIPGDSGKGIVTAQYQCGYPVIANTLTHAWNITAPDANMSLHTFGPSLTLGAAGPLNWGKSWINQQVGNTWYSLKGDYTTDPQKPLVTVLVNGGKEIPMVDYLPGKIKVTVGTRSTSFSMVENKWLEDEVKGHAVHLGNGPNRTVPSMLPNSFSGFIFSADKNWNRSGIAAKPGISADGRLTPKSRSTPIHLLETAQP